MRAALLSLLLVSQIAVLVAILRRGLVRPFLFFFLYVLTLAARQARLSLLERNDPEYLQFWAVSLVLLIPLQILAAGEAAYRSLEQFEGTRSSVFAGAIAVAIVVATWIQDLQTRQTQFGLISQTDQAVGTTLFLAGVAFSLGLSWIDPLRRRNAMLHERILLFHLGILSASLFLLHQGHYSQWINGISITLSSLGFLAWAWLVRNEGEHLAPAVPRATLEPATK
jgi:hypothetical protein